MGSTSDVGLFLVTGYYNLLLSSSDILVRLNLTIVCITQDRQVMWDLILHFRLADTLQYQTVTTSFLGIHPSPSLRLD